MVMAQNDSSIQQGSGHGKAFGVIGALVATTRAYHLLPPMMTLYRLPKPLSLLPNSPTYNSSYYLRLSKRLGLEDPRGFGESKMACNPHSNYIDHIAIGLIAGEMMLRHT